MKTKIATLEASDVWRPTMNLRWFEYDYSISGSCDGHAYKTQVLQQLHINQLGEQK